MPGTDPIWLTEAEHRTLTVVMDHLLPADGVGPGAGESGGADYVDQLLGAFTFDPPHVWAGGPFSGRHGGEAGFENWIPLGAVEELAWRIRIEGTLGIPERSFNGEVVGYQEQYRSGLAAIGTDFEQLSTDERAERLASAVDDEFRELLFVHACESLYGDPIYGGNRGTVGWRSIGFAGDVQPRGWTDDEVSNPS